MKSIEECLDMILTDLVTNWDKPNNERDNLKGEELLKRFNLPDNMQKHEFFKRLIHRLIDDSYAEELVDFPIKKGDALEYYEKAVVITIEGYYFITERGGYVDKEKAKTTLEDRRSLETKLIVFGTLLAGAYGLEEILKVIYHHSPSLFCH